MRRTVFPLLLGSALVAAPGVMGALRPAAPQQVADRAFDVSVKTPAHTTTHPLVVIDEAHNNFHTASGRYQPFASLLRNDGYRVEAGTSTFTARALAGVDVLVISNALGTGATASTDTSPPAFTPEECEAVRTWVQAGGALLLVSDHTPMGEANEALGRAFGTTMGKGFVFMVDVAHRGAGATQLVFSRANGLLGDHPITRGRNMGERVTTVKSFTGQSLTVPPGATPLLSLGPDAWEAPTRTALQAITRDQPITDQSPASVARFTAHGARRAGGRAQGLAMTVGRGRVVILGEAALLSAQVTGADGQGQMGMNVPGSDDKQFALNVLRWLTRVL